jgi:hypothetical protein
MKSRTMKRVFAVLLLSAALASGRGYTRVARASDDLSRLTQQSHEPDVQHRRDAARELGKLTPLPPEGIEAMAGLLERQDQDTLIARFAYQVLCNAGASAIPVTTRFAQSEGRFVSQEGIDLLGCLAIKDKDVWPVLIGLYKQDPASNAIEELAGVGAPVLPVLIDALKRGDPSMRAGAIMTIERMVYNARTLSTDYIARNHVVIVTPNDLAPAEPELAAALRDPDLNIRNGAAIALNYADPNDRRALPIFIDAISERNLRFIDQSISGVQAMGSLAMPAVPVLEHALAPDPDVTIQVDAGKALVQIEGEKACVPLEQAIAKDRDWRSGHIGTLLGINPPCPRLIATLIGTFRDEYPADSNAVAALSKMGSLAVPALAAALKSSNL